MATKGPIMLHVDMSKFMERELKKAGYRDGGRIPDFRGKIMVGGRDTIILAPPLAPATMPGKHGPDMAGELDKHLGKIVAAVDRLMAEGRAGMRVVLRGGGDVPIPEDFLDEMKRRGIEVVVLVPNARWIEICGESRRPGLVVTTPGEWLASLGHLEAIHEPYVE